MNLIILSILFIKIFCNLRPSSEPYITGDAFRNLANHKLDAEYINKYKMNPQKYEQILDFNPNHVKNNDIVFVDSRAYKHFFKNIFPHINSKFILISNNSDFSSPGKYIKELYDEKIIHWFGTNPSMKNNDKFTSLPLGILNRIHHWTSKNCAAIIDETYQKNKDRDRKIFCYSNFTVHKIRKKIYEEIKDNKFIYWQSRKPEEKFYYDLVSSNFTLSPIGGGLDCFRTWEALYLRSFPVVTTSYLDELFEDLPVVILQNWKQLNEDLLNQKLHEFKNKRWNWDKLNFSYWKKLILSKKIS
jgi:hypothetical protein